MTTPPWGHKPPRVDNEEQFWMDAPPGPSERAVYWVRRWREGSWKPNRWLLRECGDCRAGMLGAWLWEGKYVFGPLFQVICDDVPVGQAAIWCGDWVREAPGPYWRVLDERSRPDGQPLQDQVAAPAEAMGSVRARGPRNGAEMMDRVGEIANLLGGGPGPMPFDLDRPASVLAPRRNG